MPSEILERNIATPIYRQVYSLIEEDLKKGRYDNTMKLPPEHALTRMYNVSRVTIRRVLGMFEEKGLIIKQKGKGTFIAKGRNIVVGKKLLRIVCSDYPALTSRERNPLSYFIITRIMNGIFKAMNIHDFVIDTVSLLHFTEEKYYDYLLQCNDQKPDGFIFIRMVPVPIIDRMISEKIPYIIIGNPFKEDSITTPLKNADNLLPNTDYNFIYSDHEEGMRLAVNQLADQGRKNIAYIGWTKGPSGLHRPRYEGYKRGLNENGLVFKKTFVEECSGVQEKARLATERLLQNEKNIDAIVCGTDIRAFGVIEALKKSSRKIPEDVAVTGFDNINESAFSIPPLTTVDIGLDSQGYAAVDWLLKNAEKESQKPYLKLIEPKLINRQST